MTTTGDQLALRVPAWVRGLGVAFLVAWPSVFLVHEEARDDFLMPGAMIALIAVVVVARMLFSSVVGTADGRLTVRNIWSTRTFLREEIDGVEIDRAGNRGWALFLRLSDGTRHPLDVTETPFLGPFVATLERQADDVQVWLDGRYLAWH